MSSNIEKLPSDDEFLESLDSAGGAVPEDDVETETKDFDELEECKPSSQRQRILKAQIMDQKVADEEAFLDDDVDPMLTELIGISTELVSDYNQNTLNEMDETLAKLRLWQDNRMKESQQLYEDDKKSDGEETKCDGKPESDTIEDYESEIMTIRLADNKTIASLEAMMHTPRAQGDGLTDLSRLNQQMLDVAAAPSFPSPEKLRRELEMLTFSSRTNSYRNSFSVPELSVDWESYKREDQVLNEGADLEENMSDLEMKLREFSGDLDFILSTANGLPSPEKRMDQKYAPESFE